MPSSFVWLLSSGRRVDHGRSMRAIHEFVRYPVKVAMPMGIALMDVNMLEGVAGRDDASDIHPGESNDYIGC